MSTSIIRKGLKVNSKYQTSRRKGMSFVSTPSVGFRLVPGFQSNFRRPIEFRRCRAE